MLGTLAAVPAALMLGSRASGVTDSAPACATTLGQPPPEWGRNADGWPAYGYDLHNTRNARSSAIRSRNVDSLRVKWRHPLASTPYWGAIAANPLVLDGTVYIQGLDSNITALDLDTGQVQWQYTVDIASPGPNGVAVGWGHIYATTPTGVFALDARTHKRTWTRELTTGRGGVNIAPQVYDGVVVVSTVPLNAEYQGEEPGVAGIVYGLDAQTGAIKWQFCTVQDPDLWGRPDLNFGGGLWYPVAIDSHGRLFASVANPGPFPGTPDLPNGSSRPGPNLFTNSLITLDGQTGALLRYQQPLPHDIRDYDLQISPIFAELPIAGRQTEVVITAGKAGKVYAYRADDGRPLWECSVGRHENDTGPLPDQPVTVLPGALGGVETPMALANEHVYVAWVDWAKTMSATTFNFDPSTLGSARGGLAAIDATTGRLKWTKELDQMALGGATVAGDVVFTSTYAGWLYAFDAATGDLLWSDRARAGINSSPAIAGDMLIIGAGAGGTPYSGPPDIFPDPVIPELIAYQLT